MSTIVIFGASMLAILLFIISVLCSGLVSMITGLRSSIILTFRWMCYGALAMYGLLRIFQFIQGASLNNDKMLLLNIVCTMIVTFLLLFLLIRKILGGIVSAIMELVIGTIVGLLDSIHQKCQNGYGALLNIIIKKTEKC